MEETQTVVDQLSVPSQEVAVKGVAQILADDAAKPPQILTETQFRALRRQYFTVRHGRCQPCGHRFDVITEPRTNCEHCWFHWLNEHGELIQTADRAYTEQGEKFLIAMRGLKFTKMFLRFMSTLARLKQEAEQTEREKCTEISTT